MCYKKDIIKSLRRELASKLRGPGFKSQPGTVGGTVNIIMWGARPWLKTSFELKPVTEGKQGIFPYSKRAKYVTTIVYSDFPGSSSKLSVCLQQSSNNNPYQDDTYYI